VAKYAMTFPLSKRLVAEAVGTALLLATVVGSGIMADGLSDGNDGIALLGNTLATGAILVVLILIFGPVSGAHFNPAVTMAFTLRKEIAPSHALAYVLVQIAAGIFGVLLAHAMFDVSLVQSSTKLRSGPGQWLSEGVATFGLLASILGCLRWKPDAVPYAVGLFISAGYWFTASTSFANPAVTIARSLTDTFSGIQAAGVPAFIAAQLIGAVLALGLFSWLFSDTLSKDVS
jgi:glycerol uptake facilitator-like aquaporin